MNAIHSLPEYRDGAAAALATPMRGRRAPRVAIIDDDEGLARGLRRTLEADGYEVYVAGDGRPGATVLILTARGEEGDEVRGRLGGGDSVTGQFGLSELLMRIEALIRDSGRARAEEPRVEEIGFGDVRINPAASIVTKGGHPVALTPKELDLLLALVQNPGVVLSRMSLLREVWGHRAEVMTRTVDIHVAELRRKLEDVPAKPRHFATVWKRGYRFDP